MCCSPPSLLCRPLKPRAGATHPECPRAARGHAICPGGLPASQRLRNKLEQPMFALLYLRHFRVGVSCGGRLGKRPLFLARGPQFWRSRGQFFTVWAPHVLVSPVGGFSRCPASPHLLPRGCCSAEAFCVWPPELSDRKIQRHLSVFEGR